eukprot:PITA_29873
MNPTLKDIFKEELQKLLDAGFIYPISNNEWVSPLVLVRKNLCRLSRTKQHNQEGPFPFAFHRSSARWPSREEVLLLHRWVKQEALTNLGKFLAKCIEMNRSLSPKKYEFLMTKGTVQGHTISQQGLQVDLNKIAIIQRVPPPQKVRDVRSFLGLAGYYRRFIKDFSKLASPLFGLSGKDVEFIWTNNYQEALDTLKGKLVTAQILRGPN